MLEDAQSMLSDTMAVRQTKWAGLHYSVPHVLHGCDDVGRKRVESLE